MKQKTPSQIKGMHEQLSAKKRIKICEACGSQKNIERNHAIIYAGKRLNEEYAIRALCKDCHRGNSGTIDHKANLICKINAITEGLEHLKATYPKRDWDQELKSYLFDFNKMYANT